MTNSHYFGDDTMDFGADAGDVRALARRQFLFSLAIGALLLASAAMIGAQPIGADRSPSAAHQARIGAPALVDGAAPPVAFAPRG